MLRTPSHVSRRPKPLSKTARSLLQATLVSIYGRKRCVTQASGSLSGFSSSSFSNIVSKLPILHIDKQDLGHGLIWTAVFGASI